MEFSPNSVIVASVSWSFLGNLPLELEEILKRSKGNRCQNGQACVSFELDLRWSYFMPRLKALFACLFLAVLPGVAHAQSELPVPEKRTIPEKDVDFYGSDLNALFDTTYDACVQACLSNDQCQAFTFNSRSNACFPKSEVTERQGYEGALSAIVARTETTVLDRAKARARDLSFLGASDLAQAKTFAAGLSKRHSVGSWTLEQLEQGALTARSEKRFNDAVLWAGSALVLSDRSDLWSDYSFYAQSAKGKNTAERGSYADRALLAGINAYLRAPTAADQSAALLVLSSALEAKNRGRDTIPALRLAQQVFPDANTDQALNDAIAKYGFRIVDHTVDSDGSVPRICATFNETLVAAGLDYAPYVQLPGTSFTVDQEGRQLCIEGVAHGERYKLTFRAGLPADSGELMSRDTTLDIYVRDRAPAVRFPGRAYVLPKAGDPAVPIIGVNLSEVELELFRVSDRNLLRTFQQNYFGRPLSKWEQEGFARDVGEAVWSGTGQLETRLNEDVTTRLPMAEAIGDLPAGVYTLQARIKGSDPFDDPTASQWFVISDIGLSSMSGADGLHVFARSLASADALEGATVTLLSRSNRVLAETSTDADGYARFDSGLTRGQQGASPALVLVKYGADDTGFLSLTDPEFDLSDRGVEGREPSGAIDVFLATDRGAYRAGEVIYATALARDGTAQAIPDLPLIAVLNRPDGVEYSRHVSAKDLAGGHVFNLPVGASAPRGTWTLKLYADVKAAPLASQTVLVEDFLPERIDFDLALPDRRLKAGDTAVLDVRARYLFGAPAADLPIEGEVRVTPVAEVPEYPGYQFGRFDDAAQSQTNFINGGSTDATGLANVEIDFPEIVGTSRPQQAELIVRVSEGSGRPVERRLTQMLAPSGSSIGIKPLFEGIVAEGTAASFNLIALNPEGTPETMQVKWTLNRLTTRYQWYSQFGQWDWEPTTTRKRVASGEVRLDKPLDIDAPVAWGNYELVVERVDGAYTASSVNFYAGWYAPVETSSTPDTLELSLDKDAYKSGETAKLRLIPRYAGKAVVTVVSNRLIDFRTVNVIEGENLIALPVTDDWGAGAYVTASVIRPMEVSAGRNPARALGLRYAGVDPGDKQLSAQFDMPDEAEPRSVMDVVMRVDGVAAGQTAFATVAAVDVGILNLTAHASPDPAGHYFGQRKLGVGMRDLYGRLIDGLNGAKGTIRSGGDAMADQRMQSPPPTEELVAYFSGPITVGPDGLAKVSFELPSFNGTVRLMGVAWSEGAVGQAEKDILVRDPVVVTATLPRFLAPGDTSQLLLELVHASGPAGAVQLEIQSEGLQLDTGNVPELVTLGEKEKRVFAIPVSAQSVGLHSIQVGVLAPGGRLLRKELTIPVQINDPEITRTNRFTLAAGDTFTFSDDVFAGLRPGTAKATLAMGPLARFDAPGLLMALDRYPYGCTEQTTSQALPLLYFDQVAQAMGLAERENIRERVDAAIDRVLSRQSSSGGFGLWRPLDGDFWLDAYVTDFLSRARAQGYDVPDRAFSSAMDNLRNRVNYAPDFDNGGTDIAYALMVLAREGAATMGDLRYFADVKGADFSTPLATAQLASALSFYGDQKRADALFVRAAQQMLGTAPDADRPIWRTDYGTQRRDLAAVLTLAAEAGTQVIDQDALATRITANNERLSTQEAVWSLMAASALVDAAPQAGFRFNGVPVNGPLVQVLEDQTSAEPVLIDNSSGKEATLTLTTFGVPEAPEPAGGNGYAIKRTYYTLDGQAADPTLVTTGTRLVTVLTVTPFEGSEARLMVDDPLPAGFEIDNPNLLRGGDIKQLDWLKPALARHAEFRQDRFLAAVDWRKKEPFSVAYIVRAISPGSYHHPAASVEDMYRPHFRAHTDAGRIEVR